LYSSLDAGGGIVKNVVLAYLLFLLDLGGAGLTLLLLRLALLQEGLWDQDVILGWDAPALGLERLDNEWLYSK
jgi:hypothetical protein